MSQGREGGEEGEQDNEAPFWGRIEILESFT